MNTTDLEIVPKIPQPARITRRTFVKRTSSTAIVTVLALHAFRNEARAEGANYVGVEITTFPPGTTYTAPADPQESNPRTAHLPAAVYSSWHTDAGNAYRVRVGIVCTSNPTPITQVKLPISKRWHYYSAAWTFTFDCTIYVEKPAGNPPLWTAFDSTTTTASINVTLDSSGQLTGTVDGEPGPIDDGDITGNLVLDFKKGVTTFSGTYGTQTANKVMQFGLAPLSDP